MIEDWDIESGLPISAMLERITPEFRDAVQANLNKAIKELSPFKAEYQVQKRNGSVIWVEAQGKVTLADDGTPARFFGTCINISDRKAAQLELIQAHKEADRANQAKSSFLANMSHEIRSPLGAIMGFADLIVSPETSPEEIRTYGEIITRNSEHLLRIIDDILDLSKVEAGKIVIEEVDFSLTDLLSDFSSLWELRAKDKAISFNMKALTDLPDHVTSDPTRLRQILTNVVGNAVKFTEHGQVEMTVEFVNDVLKFTVSDTGPGLTSEQAAKLFQPFQQADASVTRKFGGTGLGLVLTRALATALGGNFTLEKSTPGEGSTFVVTIKVKTHEKVRTSQPQTHTATKESAKNKLKPLDGMRVLIVEDTPDIQVIVNYFLTRAGAITKTANNGEEAVTEALQNNYDVILMDIQMPGMDGHTATRLLRSKGYAKPIFALTAHAMKDERERVKESGFTAFLTKPISRDDLLAALSQFQN